MKNRKRIVLEASEGITFRVQDEKDEIVIKAIMEKNKFYNYRNPKIPEGYCYVYGDDWCNGLTIRNQTDGSEFVWIPVLWLDDDSTLDGNHSNEKFGRKNWYNFDFSEEGYHEEVNQEFVESVKKYGGFYFSKYHASKENGKLVFKKGNMPWVNINYYDAATLAVNYAICSKDVQSCITNGAAFDSVLRWIIKSKTKTFDEVVTDSTSWGNYRNCSNSTKSIKHTGSNKKWSALNIYDIAGNVAEWTSEKYGNSRQVLRGGNYSYDGNGWPAASRSDNIPDYKCLLTSFRAVLYLK